MTLLNGQVPLLISLILIAFGIWWMIPARRIRNRWVGLTFVLLGIVGQLSLYRVAGSPLVDDILFWLFGGGALFFGALMITHHRPVYAALWFALATLSTCGLLLTQSAPFLAAATIIVYAGAIIVTFVFVIMLAQQAGTTAYDQRSRRPALAVVAAFVLLSGILTVLHQAGTQGITAIPQPSVAASADATDIVNGLSRPQPGAALGTLHGLGRALFGDYLYFIELAGTLLLIASIGAIAIAPRRGQGTI